MKASLREFESRRSGGEFAAVERHAVAIRKLLRQIAQNSDRRTREVVGDAVAIALSIEQLAQWARRCPAEDLVEVEFLIDDLSSILEVNLDEILAS